MKKQANRNWSLGSKSLIVFQHVIALVLISATIVIVSQVAYLKQTDMGFDRETVLLFPLESEMLAGREPLARFLHNRSDIQSFTFCDNPPSNEKVWGGTIQFDNSPEWETWAPRYAIGDTSYVKTFGIRLLAGRNFTTDATPPEFLVNDNMARKLGFDNPEAIIGKSLLAGGLNDQHSGRIVGVVADFNTNSLNEAISPTVIGYHAGRLKHLAVKYTGNDPGRLVEALETQWKSWYPNTVFEYAYYDEQIADLYGKEALLERLIWVAAVIAITISSLGFLGLLSIMVVRRTKEIGIRKVLGASIPGIVKLLATDFMRWVGLAFVIAVPIAGYAMSGWLEQFIYRIELQWWMFMLAGVFGFAMTGLTIGYHAIKAARANPVESLRDE